MLSACERNDEGDGVEISKLSLLNDDDRRPLVHFTPPKNWMNDPNGMVYYEGEYHLFYQYHPGGSTWGPMHWGHAISTDLFNWVDLPVALYPDHLGTIFSGCVVVDTANTAGFKTGPESPFVAIYTSAGARQTQSIAYSNDKGRTWTKYDGNPVLPNPGIDDFRDPKVIWHAPSQKWIMSLATGREISFYSSANLKEWSFESSFGKGIGAQGGVWECPDLFPVSVQNSSEVKWLLLVSLNPGGPNGGSATQYFVGDFDGKVFHPENTSTSWLDTGTDNYAGVTFANIPDSQDRRIFIGWMSNWVYAERVPTQLWRSAMTVPRELNLIKTATRHQLISSPVEELNSYVESAETIPVFNNQSVVNKAQLINGSYVLDFTANITRNDTLILTLGNDIEQLTVLFDFKSNWVTINRSKSGLSDFHHFFNNPIRSEIGTIADPEKFNVQLIVDKTSAEIFWGAGMQAMTVLFFPKYSYHQLKFYWSSGTPVVSTVNLASIRKSFRD